MPQRRWFIISTEVPAEAADEAEHVLLLLGYRTAVAHHLPVEEGRTLLEARTVLDSSDAELQRAELDRVAAALEAAGIAAVHRSHGLSLSKVGAERMEVHLDGQPTSVWVLVLDSEDVERSLDGAAQLLGVDRDRLTIFRPER